MPFDEGPPADWQEVSFGIQQGYLSGYLAGHAVGHRDGFEQGIRVASARDETFARMVEQEFHRRTLQGEREADLVRRLLDALRTEQNRQNDPNFYSHRRAA